MNFTHFALFFAHEFNEQDSMCFYCGKNCMATFDGNLIVAIGLNNALKAQNHQFRSQNVPRMLDNLFATLAEMIPKARETYYIRPIEVPIWTKNEAENEVNYNIYYSILEHLEKKNISRATLELTNDWFGPDLTHLKDSKSRTYWEENFDDIFAQIHEKCHENP